MEMKRIGYSSAALGMAVVLAAGSGYAQNPAGSGSAQPRGGQTDQRQGTQNQQASKPLDAREFINHMTIANMAEIQLGKLAADRGMINDVKGFGTRMVDDHTKANQELTQIAKQLGVTPPAQLDQKHRDLHERLSKLQGREFDREYMSAMVQGHQEVLAMLRARTGNQRTSAASPDDAQQNPARPAGGPQQSGSNAQQQPRASSSSGEQALNQYAQKTEPIVEEHLELARRILADLNRH
jgi:putative membrane protein